VTSLSSPHDNLLEIIQTSNQGDTLEARSVSMQKYLEALSDAEIGLLLREAGFIPEAYAHDSSEEKAYAKAMDVVVAETLRRFGYATEVSKARSDSADVTASWGSSPGDYRIVLDAKACRLSRTALNPKDYKIEALNTWKKGADSGCLVGPMALFPQDNSRLYVEAVRFDVTLLTFTHLEFLLTHRPKGDNPLKPLWELAHNLDPHKTTGSVYWRAASMATCRIAGTSEGLWEQAQQEYYARMLAVAEAQARYLWEERQRVPDLPRQELVALAIAAMGIDRKLSKIEEKRELAQRMLDDD